MGTSAAILHQRRALVTGGGSGIGKAIGVRLAQAGARIALLERDPDKARQAVDDIGGPEAGHIALQADVSNEREMASAFETLAREWTSLDIVVANAGINGVWCPLPELSVEEWDKTIETNLRGTFLTTKLALSLLGAGGSVVVIASINGTRIFSNTGATAYACSKAGQVAFVKMMALELARQKIRVNVVCPGAIETKISETTTHRNLESVKFPIEFPEGDVPLNEGQPGVPEQVAEAVLFLASNAASHITGTELYVDGAQSLIQ